MSIELQRMLFGKGPTRDDLLKYEPVMPKTRLIQIFRNHSFELIEHTIYPYLDFAGIGASFEYSGYDDSFSFLQLDASADLYIIWADGTRYKDVDPSSLVSDRVCALREKTDKSILVVAYGADVSSTDPGVAVVDLAPLKERYGDRFEDRRAQAITGTPLSRQSLMELSKILGTQYIPALLAPRLKAVIIDFDNTIYQGVLGEDGAQGLQLTPGHIALQERLVELSRSGLFLCAVSKNDQRDVDELLDSRKDFPLKKENFTKVIASWKPKYQSVQEIAAYLNIGVSSMVFVDDNIGELTELEMHLPDIKLVYAEADASITANVLRYFPGLLRLKASNQEDQIRKDDVQANEMRKALRDTMSQEDYIRSLKLRLQFDYKKEDQIARIAELSNKTNQFIFNYARYTPAQVSKLFHDHSYMVLTVSLADRLSDSGLVGVCVGKDMSDHVSIEECFVSCRALGRGIDDIIVLGAIQKILNYFHKTKVRLQFQKGPRNKPAEDFVFRCLRPYLACAADFFYEIPKDLLEINESMEGCV